MAPFIFRCPNTALNVQGFTVEPGTGDGHSFEGVTCTACARVHLVNPKNGRLLGEDAPEQSARFLD